MLNGEYLILLRNIEHRIRNWVLNIERTMTSWSTTNNRTINLMQCIEHGSFSHICFPYLVFFLLLALILRRNCIYQMFDICFYYADVTKFNWASLNLKMFSFLFVFHCALCAECVNRYFVQIIISQIMFHHIDAECLTRLLWMNSSQLLATGIVISLTILSFSFNPPPTPFLFALNLSLTFFYTRIYYVDSRFTICNAQQLIRKWINWMHIQMHHQLIQIIQTGNISSVTKRIYWVKQIANCINNHVQLLDQSY